MLDRKTIKKLLSGIKPVDGESEKEARRRWNKLAKPVYGLGYMEDMICKIAAIQSDADIDIGKKAVVVMCADNGIVEEGVSQAGSEVTAIVSRSIARQKGSINLIAQYSDTDVIPVDVGIASDIDCEGLLNKKTAYGTKNILQEDAMKESELLEAIYTGIDMARLCKDMGYTLLGCGEMGIGNTSISAALISVLLSKPVRETAGLGAGLSEEGFERKIQVIEESIRRRKPDKEDVFDVMKKIGGLDIAALCGLYLGAALYKIPVVIDGMISLTSAYLAYLISPLSSEYMLASHLSREPQAGELLKLLGIRAVIDAGMGLGEGTGAAMLFGLLDMSVNVYKKLHGFSDIGMEAYDVKNAARRY